MTTEFASFADARTYVCDSGIVDWDWGNGRDGDEISDRLARLLWERYSEIRDNDEDANAPTFSDALRDFVVAELGDDPDDYSL
jgi:hypothetical protein